MRQPVLVPSGGVLTNLLSRYLLSKESITINIKKLPSRKRSVEVLFEEPEWKKFIMTEVNV